MGQCEAMWERYDGDGSQYPYVCQLEAGHDGDHVDDSRKEWGEADRMTQQEAMERGAL